MRLFNKITLQTPESVELEFTLAGIGNRAYALLIDYTILSIVSLCFLLLFYLLIWLFPPFRIIETIFGNSGGSPSLATWLLAILLLVVVSIYAGYFVFLETLWQGQTLGKRRVKIRVISDDGRPIKLQQATLRALLRPIDDILFLGVFFIVLGQREKRIGDWVAGTLVIQEADSNSSISISQEAYTLADRLRLEADLLRLTPEDFAVIKEYLHRRTDMIPEARRNLSQKLASRVKGIIVLEQVPQKVTANLFLEAVYLAYQHSSTDSD